MAISADFLCATEKFGLYFKNGGKKAFGSILAAIILTCWPNRVVLAGR